jgi:SAM-dependent methyltransferase
VDLGCGSRKQQGFIGIDRFPMPGVDIVADMNKRLPLDDHSVDYLVASHSLEHVDDLIFTMQEIYRVCKHRALVCIVAPYQHTSLNMTNPFHKQVFNEHTPRFFTTSHHTLIDELDYSFPHALNWGVGESDNSNCNIDFRCLRMEFFYFPQYRRLAENEKRKLRQTSINIVDQIMYHLLVVKEDISNKEIEDMAKNIEYQEPTYVTLRRYREQVEDLLLQNEEMRCAFEEEREEKEQNFKELESRLQEEQERHEQDCERMEARYRLEKEQADLKLRELENQLQEEKEKHERDCERMEAQFRLEMDQKQEKHKQSFEKIRVQHQLEMEQSVQKRRELEVRLKEDLAYSRAKLQPLVSEYVKISFDRYNCLAGRCRRIFSGCSDLTGSINNECRSLLDATILQSSLPLQNYVLNISPFIRNNEIFAYQIQTKQESLKSIRIVLSCLGDLCAGKAIIAVEILSQEEEILRSIFFEPHMIKHNLPLTIEFEPIHGCAGKNLWVRLVGLENIEKFGIRVYEWQRYSKILKSKLDRKLFAELI